MPQVPRSTRQVSPIALPGARLTQADTPESLGAGVAAARANAALAEGRAGQQTGLALAGFGETVGRVGNVLSQVVIQERRRADEVALMEADNRLSAWENARLYDPQSGALTLKGKDAMGVPEAVGEDFEKFAGEIEGSLGSPRAKAAFARLRSNRSAQLDLTLRRHVYGEMQTYEANELKAFLENTTNTAIRYSNEPARVGMELAKGIDALERSGPRLGLGKEQIDREVSALQTKTHVGVIDSLLSQGHTKAATVYFEEAKGQISGDAVARVEKALHEGTLRKEAQTKTDEILGAGGSLTEQRTKAKAIDDPEVRDSVMQRLEHEASVREREQREVEETQLRSVYATLEQNGGDVDAIDPAAWSRLGAKDLAPARAYARAIAKGEPIETNLETYYALMNKAAGPGYGFLKENLLRYKDQLSEGDFKQLAGLQRSIRTANINDANDKAKNAAKLTVDEFLNSSQVFEERVRAYGMGNMVDAKEGTPEKQAYYNLRGIIDRRVRALGGGETGKKITNDELREIADEELSTFVKIRRQGEWTGIFTKAPFFDEDVEVRPFELTLDDITTDQRKRIEQLLHASRIPVNDATVLEAFIEARTRR